MTMFAKGHWTIFKMTHADGGSVQDAFTQILPTLAEDFSPLLAQSRASALQLHQIALAPFCLPRLGDGVEVQVAGEPATTSTLIADAVHDWTYDPATHILEDGKKQVCLEPDFWRSSLGDWEIGHNIYAVWLMDFAYKDTSDIPSKKEAISYDYGCPFNLQSAEVKKEITGEVAQMNVLVRKQYQMIFDFSQNLLWINAATPQAILDLAEVTGKLHITLERPEVGDADIKWEECLEQLYTTTTIGTTQLERLNELRQNGSITPQEDPYLEKLVTTYLTYSPVDGEYMGLSTPASVTLYPGMLPSSSRSIPECFEFLFATEHGFLSSAEITFAEDKETHKGDKVKHFSIPQFTLQMESPAGVEGLPGLVIHGYADKNFKHALKEWGRTDLHISDYWYLFYTRMRANVFHYFSVMREMTEALEKEPTE